MARKLLFYFLPFTFYLFTAGCGPSAQQYQEHVNIPKAAWDYTFWPEFKFEITDTAAAYQLVFLIRHTDAYPFNNIWLLLDTKAPGEKKFQTLRTEIPLAAATGQWLGRGMGELYEQRVAINTASNPAFFHKKGLYTIRMAQDMRRNPLPDVLQVGLRIDKLGVPQQAQ